MHMIKGAPRRLMSLLLVCSLTLGLLPAAAGAASWADPYLDKLVSWGVMRGDQAGNLDPDREITRAEYVSMINRAYGYTESAPTPFTDVSPAAWYAEDIGIAYKAGYFTGTSSSAASPESTLTREQATVILGRNLMLREGAGESLDFVDSRDLSNWSRGIVKTAAEYGVVTGLPDGTFQPRRNITRGEVASLLVKAVGTPVNQSGEYALGSVYGNVTISASGVTLRDTVIAGDLYLTGGVGLGYVTLENVKVLGKIVASGAGEANKGDSSIILRNVTSQEMVVDSPANQYVTIRSEGDTDIARTSVRTPSYLEDVTGAGMGLKYIELDGEQGTALELSGNIKEVVNLTPGSTLNLALGTAQQITVDERASNTKLNIASGGEVKILNMDTGAGVTGTGDVGTININANGANVSMLPENIVIRPGVSANVGGQVMDSGTGAESSQAPKLLSGYPRTTDVAPTTASALFSTNKSGTVYWAVSSITDGSVAESDLISPPSYGSKILRSGSVKAAAASTELNAKITGLTSDGSYYLSAVLVDSRDQRSPVKVIAFTTPDDTVPNFATGYPVMTKITDTSAQVTVMSTKSCKLYYALLPKGSTAPTAADFKASAVTGSLGFGMLNVTKNTTYPITVNDKLLEELETYDLYLWLNDADNAKSSAVKKLTFTTVDRTPPKYNTEPTVNSVKETSVGLYVNLNEAATFYWAVVKEGTEYPKPLAGSSVSPELTSETAKLQVMAGMNALKSGRVTCAADKDATFNITGLEAETAYDLYYVAQDKAGNYSQSVQKITLHTLDNQPPVVEQKFTRFNSSDSTNPLSDTDVQLIFSEGIRDNRTNDVFLALYEASRDATKPQSERDAAREQLAQRLREDVQLWTYGANGLPTLVGERTAANQDQTDLNWVIDYRYATVAQKEGKVTVTFPTNAADKTKSALNLRSGGTYYFIVDGIADTSDNKNIMPVTTLPEFSTVFAQVNLAATDVSEAAYDGGKAPIDVSFQLLPVSTENVESSVMWDMLIWSDTPVKFELYRREKNADGSNAPSTWDLLGESQIVISAGGESPVAVSLTRAFLQESSTPAFGALKDLSESKAYEYGISFTEVDGLSSRGSWTQRITVGVSVAAGASRALTNLSGATITPSYWQNAQDTEGVTAIGVKRDFSIIKQFQDLESPSFIQGHPQFSAGDTRCDVTVMLNRPATLYYVVALNEIDDNHVEAGVVPPLLKDNNALVPWDQVPKKALFEDGGTAVSPGLLSSPTMLDITNPKYGSVGVITGSADYKAGAQTIHITGLTANKNYHMYFVLKGASQYSEVKYYGFTTGDVTAPQITLNNDSPSVQVTTSQDAVLDYVLFNDQVLPSMFKDSFSDHVDDIADVPESYQTLTVLAALVTTDTLGDKDKQGYSVFDNYANKNARDRLGAIIRNTTPDSSSPWVKAGTLDMIAGRLQTVNCGNEMSDNATYVFLAVSHHAQGAVDTYKAVTSIRRPDTEPPAIRDIKTSITTQIPDDPKEILNASFDGTVQITISKNLYQDTEQYDPKTGLRIVLPVLNCGRATAEANKGVSILDVVRASFPKLTIPSYSSNSKPTNTFTLEFKEIRHNATITLFSNGYISDANGTTTTKQLVLTFDALNMEDSKLGFYTPKFTYEWK